MASRLMPHGGIVNRTFLLFGAAFLVTVAAALFAPLLLPFAVVLPAYALLFPLLPTRRPGLALALGCLAALVVCAFYTPRLQRLRVLAGSSQPFTGVVFYQQQLQLVYGTLGDGSTVLCRLSPPAEAADGDWISGNLHINDVSPDSLCYPLSGGAVVYGGMPETGPAAPGKLHPYIRLNALRDTLAQRLLALSPSTGTAVTLSLLFSYRQALPSGLSADFASSGLSHLMSVSGLHLSIMVWWLLALLRKMRAGRGVQLVAGVFCILPILLASGLSPSAFRASVMLLLTLVAMVLDRRSDAFTSLMLAAVLLTVFCPPILADLSFILSFLASLGILLFAPRIAALLRRLSLPQGISGSVAVSLAAQLATSLPSALVFGRLPLLGVFANLAVIPLIYPVLICGFAATLCTAVGLAAPAAALLFVCNIFSSLIALLAGLFAKIPFGTLSVLFPAELIAAAVLLSALFILLMLPVQKRFTPARAAAAAVAALVLVAVPLNSHFAVSVVSSDRSGSLIIAGRHGAVLVDCSATPYQRRADTAMLEQLGFARPTVLLRPDLTGKEALASADFYGIDPVFDQGLLIDGVSLTGSSPHYAEFTVGDTKMMKFFSGYAIIEGEIHAERLSSCSLFCDRLGNLLWPGGARYILRRQDGYSLVRLPT